MALTMCIVHENGEVACTKQAEDDLSIYYEAAYEKGDQIIIATKKVPCYLMVQIDDAVKESFIYVTLPKISYRIPFDEKKVCYSPKSFSGNNHLLTVRYATPEEIASYKNLACNPMAQHNFDGYYPHASANVETRGEAVFAARNAIDGIRINNSHGNWPYGSWGINQQDDATITIDFGREVILEKLVMYIRADFPHDNWWQQVTVSFSDGSKLVWQLVKTSKAQHLPLNHKKVSCLTLSNLIKADDPSPFPALTQIEAYGVEA